MEKVIKKVSEKAKNRSWKTIVGAALNTAGVPLLSMPDMYLKIAGVICLAVGSAMLAWDETKKETEVKQTEEKKP